jgi:hypothetical protein
MDPTATPLDDQESQADPEKTAEQDQIREVTQVKNVRSKPANQRQLEEEHQKAEGE